MASWQSGPARRRARLVRVSGVGLSVGGLAFVVRAVALRWDDVRAGAIGVTVGWLLAAMAAAVAGMMFIALRWSASAHIAGGHLEPVDAVTLYFRGEIAKYLPGGVWAFVGRAELARRRGMPRRTAYASVALSLVALYAGAAATAVVLAPVALDVAPMSWPVLGLVGEVVAAGVAGVAIRRDAADRLVLPRLGTMARLVAGYVPAWLLIGTSTWCVARSIAEQVPFTEVLFATAVSWLAGFLAVPAPGGVGVREAVFVAVLGPLPGDVTAVTALLARVLFMITDAGGALIASGPWSRPLPTSNPSEDEGPGQGARDA